MSAINLWVQTLVIRPLTRLLGLRVPQGRADKSLVTYQNGSYAELYPGASGGRIDPDEKPQLPGAHHRSAGYIAPVTYRDGMWWTHGGAQRNPYAADLGGGRAASLPHIPGVFASDKTHHDALDGHKHSAVSSHPDGQFAMNTAATSDNSSHANSEVLRAEPREGAGALLSASRTFDIRSGQFRETRGNIAVSNAQLLNARSTRLRGTKQGELLIKGTSEDRMSDPTGRLLNLTPTQLGLGVFGLWGAWSLLR